MSRGSDGRFYPGGPGGPGRPAGMPNRAAVEVRTWLRGELEKPERRQRLLEQLDRDPAVLRWAYEMAYGKPHQGVALELERVASEEVSAAENAILTRIEEAAGALARELKKTLAPDAVMAALNSFAAHFGKDQSRIVSGAFIASLDPAEVGEVFDALAEVLPHAVDLVDEAPGPEFRPRA